MISTWWFHYSTHVTDSLLHIFKRAVENDASSSQNHLMMVIGSLQVQNKMQPSNVESLMEKHFWSGAKQNLIEKNTIQWLLFLISIQTFVS